jgi:hypothetical protein
MASLRYSGRLGTGDTALQSTPTEQPHQTPNETFVVAEPVVRSVVVPFNGVKIFSATMFADRGQLGEKVTAWIASSSHRTLTDIIVTQSSDAAFHCITISVFYHEALR